MQTNKEAVFLIALDDTYALDQSGLAWQRSCDADESQPAMYDTPSGMSWHLRCRVTSANALDVYVFMEGDTPATDMLVEDVAWALRARPEQIMHIREGLGLVPCQVMRQDDHGHEFEIARFDSHLEGRWYVFEKEKYVHKQTYWVQAC